MAALAGLFAAALLAACSGDTTEFANPPSFIFLGAVVDTAGQPVIGASVTATAHRLACSEQASFTETAVVRQDGTYRLHFQLLEGAACAKLRFTANGFAPDSIVDPGIAFKRTNPDSAHYNVILRRHVQ